MEKYLSHKKGFTLIELMVVIVIIGILATLGLVGFQNALKRSRDSKRIGDMKDIATAQEQYKALNGSYVTMSSSGNCTAGTAISEYKIPSDPGSNTYNCTVTGTPPTSFCVSVALEGTNNGNCTSCTSTSITTSSTTPPNNNRFCVLSKQ